MQLLFQFQCYDCGADRAEKCIDQFNSQVYALLSKSLATNSMLIVMLKKRLFAAQPGKYEAVTERRRRAPNSIHMDHHTEAHRKFYDKSHCTRPAAREYLWCDLSDHSQLMCNTRADTHRSDLNDLAIMYKCNLSSTKMDGAATIDVANKWRTTEFSKRASQLGSKPAKASLKVVNRSPLTADHRANLLKIFIKYLLIMNCIVGFAAGNLMSRNVGNDLSSKLNQTDTATIPINASADRTTSSPLILPSIMSSNPSQVSGQDAGRNKHPADAMASGYVSDEPANPFKLPSGEENSSDDLSKCVACQFREQLKAHNLASIKMHILARLSMTHPPNITGRPHISEQILQTFYQSNDFRYIRIRNDSDYADSQNEDEGDDFNEMQADDPNVSTSKHQHHHLHEYHRNGGMKSGMHEQHHHHQSSYHHYNRRSRIDNEYNEEYDYSDRGGIVYNMDYYDEPRAGRSHYDEMPYDNAEDTDEAFYSTTDVIYSFPKFSKARHRGDILEFTINNNNHLSVNDATFKLFVRGEDWLLENDPSAWMRSGGSKSSPKTTSGDIHLDESASASGTSTRASKDEHSLTGDSLHKLPHGNSKNVNSNHISISINRFVHRHQQQQNANDQEQSKKTAQPAQQQRYTRIDSNFIGEIPKGAGEWIQFNITLMVSEWIQQQQQQQKHQSVNAQSADIVQEVVIKTLEPWMRQLLVLDTNSKNRPYIEIQTRDMRKHRTKRHLAKDCRENERQSRCCRYPMRVDFRKFGWDWIIAPDIYEAYYCAGECPIGFLPKHPHTYIYSLSSSYSTCCSPRKLSPLSLLYFDDNKNVIHSVIPNMAVDKCGCS